MIFRRESPQATAALRLYEQIVVQARQPRFYSAGGVPDTLDGRFEMVVLYMALTMRRLKALGEPGTVLARYLTEAMISDMDGNLREMGAGDLGVGRRVKQMAQALYGRIAAYEAGLAEGSQSLCDALRRNLFATAAPTPQQVHAMADEVQAAAAALSAVPAAAITAGELRFAARAAQPASR
jgi:cytochrome b pre-mRNA-processing protein 3